MGDKKTEVVEDTEDKKTASKFPKKKRIEKKRIQE